MIWLSASELAGLPQLPNSKRLVNLLDKSDWQSRDRIGRGGGKEYLVPDRYLTPEFLAQVRSRFPDKFAVSVGMKKADLGESPEPERESFMTGYGFDTFKTAELADFKPQKGGQITETYQAVESEIVPDSDHTGIFARQEIVRIWRSHIDNHPDITELEATVEFCRLVQSGAITLPDWVKTGLKSRSGKLKISRNSLINWSKKTASELMPKYKGKTGTGFFDLRPEYLAVAIAVAQEFGANPRQVHFAFVSGFVKEDFGLEEVPTESQIGYWLRNLKAENFQKARAWRTGDKSILLNAQGSYSRGLKPNDKWEIDSTKADATAKKDNVVWLQSRFGEEAVRCALVACIDVATRMVRVLLVPTSNGEAICLTMADSIKAWGLPKTIKTDNGKDYIGKQVFGFCSAMGIEQKLCVVKQPWQKPHIERFMRTLQHSVEWGMLPWNTGHSVAMQQAYRKRREGDLVLPWTIADFQSWIDRWVDAYHNRLHEGLGCTPNERLAAFRAEGFAALMPRNLEANLAFALLKEEEVTLGKKGIKYEGRNYIAPELQGRVGEKFYIRVNQIDPNQIVVYDSNDLTTANLICVANWDMQLTPEEQAQVAAAIPVVDVAMFEHEKAIKSARRKVKTTVAKNPEKLLPERGGVAAIRAIQEIEAASENMVNQISAAVSAPVAVPTVAQVNDLETRRQQQLAEVAKVEAAKARRIKTAQDEKEMLWRIVRAWESKSNCDPQELAYVARWYDADEGAVEGLLFALDDLTEKRFLIWLKGQKAITQQKDVN